MAEKQNRHWTEEDDRRLLELKAAGRSAVSIAAALKWAPGAIHGRLGAIRDRAKASKELRDIEQ